MSLVDHGRIPDFPQVGDGICCWGAIQYGPERCTCWRPVYDLDQRCPVDNLAGGPPATRRRMCGKCAYRPGSPEKTGDPAYLGDADDLEALATSGKPFWCHEGMRQPVRWHHPAGVVIDAHPGGYDPPIINGVPYRADGTPAERCAGWDARNRTVTAPATAGDELRNTWTGG